MNKNSAMVTEYLINGPITLKYITGIMLDIDGKTDSGGHSIFLGQVRADEIMGKRVIAIEYSAYDAMVRLEADNIKKSLQLEFSDTKSIYLLHSTGIVKVGEISLLIHVAAGHRQDAIRACSKAVELIKEKLPIWKKEIYNDNSYEWKQNISN